MKWFTCAGDVKLSVYMWWCSGVHGTLLVLEALQY